MSLMQPDDDLRAQLEALIGHVAAKQSLSWRDAARFVRQLLREVEGAHQASVDQAGRRDEARYHAEGQGNTEGFAKEPEPIPDAFTE